jgi:hypothetical protein
MRSQAVSLATLQRTGKMADRSDMAVGDRFWAKIACETLQSCWIWCAGKSADGYGNFWAAGKTVSAHRFMYEYLHGPIVDGLHVLHTCDRPECVNPNHLRLGTPADNVSDMYAKNRQVNLRGEHHGSAKLTADMVYEIRLLSSKLTNRELAKKYGVSYAQVARIIRGERWKDH